jgi:hypothetical protein
MSSGIYPGRAAARRSFFALAVIAAGPLLSGCADIVKSTPDEVSIDTGPIGNIMPGSRHWLAWLAANDRCGAEGKSAELFDLQGSIVTYRCVKDEP